MSAAAPPPGAGRRFRLYAIEASGVAVLLIAAGLSNVVLQHPDSAVHRFLADPLERRAVQGLFMACVVVLLVYSPWGMLSGGHFNPSITIAFWDLGKVARRDALAYVASQFAGALAGVAIVGAAFEPLVSNPSVRWYVTVPGPAGPVVAFIGEFIISFFGFSVILRVSNSARYGRFTGLFAAALLAVWIVAESPLSGSSTNPARTLSTALAAHNWSGLWIYFTAPLLGMILAGRVFVALRGRSAVRCAKLVHQGTHAFPCPFACGYRNGNAADSPSRSRVLSSKQHCASKGQHP